ncbi:indole-3-acetic acid-amido synthetase GH3.6-like [Solanum tuberosum]|uniref:indole-3-acetic acid-amido synthetase GH3.6-like n=1 Tax=Solanum tuberosum TaxID=4113 RepID=UPI00073A376C|nr:PREDICTED: indole-3-acetic acid-amido synthetase GH3.6-like [Solanum tuberosum]
MFISDYKKDLEFIEEVTSNVDEVQKNVLAEILSQNAHVEYLQGHGLNGHTDRDTFKKLIPVITYQDIQPHINRIVNGDKSPILCSQPISELLASTGTSGGESKLIPTTEGELGRRFQLVKLQMSVMRQAVPNYGNGIAMYLMFIKSEEKTPGGLTARALSTSMIKSPYFDYNHHQNDRTSPTATILCPDSYQSMYSQMLCGLCQNQQVLHVGSFFVITFIRAIRFLEKHWSLLCKDIRTGSVDASITDPSVRDAVMEILKPDPKLADFIEAECSRDSWKGIITRLWPNATYVNATVTGTMAQYIPTLDYYSNSLPLVNTMYIASECSFGINLNPFCKPSEVAYTLIRTMAYFEFLPNQKEQQQLVDLADVKIGQEYELVVTTYSGLYRYRVSDVLRVAGYKNNAPQFNFLCRENVVLSIDDDKTNEVELQNAAGNLFPFDAHVTEYTSYVDIATIPSHYVLFWELRVNGSNPIPPSVFEDCCLTIEESLNSFYRKGRASDKSIGPLEIRVVEIGTFDNLMDYCISLGASMNQYKTPLCVKFAPLVDLLNSRVVSSYFSPMCPKWVPRYKNGTTRTEI